MTHINQNSTVLPDISRNEVVNVESLNVFNDMRVGNIITLVGDVAYEIKKKFSWEDVEFVFDEDARITFLTPNTVNSSITTNILSGRSLFSGALNRVDFQGVDIISKNGGECFTFTKGNIAVPFMGLDKSVIRGFDSVGTVDGIAIVVDNIGYQANGSGWKMNDCALSLVTEQNTTQSSGIDFTFTGTTPSIFFNVILSAPLSTNVTFDISGTVGSALFSGIKVLPINGGSVFNIDPATVVNGAFQIFNSSVDKSLGGTMFKAGSLDQTDPRIIVDKVFNCPDSQWIGSTGFTGNTTPTVMADTVTPVKIAGTYAPGELERFTESNGVLTYDGRESLFLTIQPFANIKLEPGIETDVVQISAYKNGEEITGTSSEQQLDAVFQTPTSPFFGRATHVFLETNDTLDTRMLDTTNPASIIATDANIIVGK